MTVKDIGWAGAERGGEGRGRVEVEESELSTTFAQHAQPPPPANPTHTQPTCTPTPQLSLLVRYMVGNVMGVSVGGWGLTEGEGPGRCGHWWAGPNGIANDNLNLILPIGDEALELV